MTVSTITTVLIVLLFINQIIILMVHTSDVTNAIVGYITMTLMGICDIISYCFGDGSLLTLIVGLAIIVWSTVLSCLTVYRFSRD